MRSSRRLTTAERWEVGFFLATMVLTGIALTAMVTLKRLPRIFAFTSAGDSVQSSPAAVPPAQWLPTLDIGSPQPIPFYTGPVIYDTLTPPAITPSPKAKTPPKVLTPEIKTYAGQQYRYVRTIQLRVTAYAPDPRCTFPYDGKTTASGLSVKTNGGHLVAADTSVIPMYSLVAVPGYEGGTTVPVLDRGGAIKGARLDVMLPTYEKAKAWGSRVIDVKIYRPQ